MAVFPPITLATQRLVILYDQLDSGRSDAPNRPANWTIDRFVSEIAAVRQAVGLKRVHLIGHSWGGIRAARYAAGQPTGLRSPILQGTPSSASRAQAGIRELIAALPGDAGTIIRTYYAGKAERPDAAAYQKAAERFLKKHLFCTDTRTVAEPYMTGVPIDRGHAVATAMTGGDLLAGFQGALEGFDNEGLLSAIVVPTLPLRGVIRHRHAGSQRGDLAKASPWHLCRGARCGPHDPVRSTGFLAFAD